jgi:NADPH2:quinone reductase
VAGLKTTFASGYTTEVSLTDLLTPKAVQACNRKATGEKFLVRP